MSAAKCPRRKIGPIERSARAANVEGEKRRHVLIVLARLLDGREDPSIREVARAARRHRMEVFLLIEKLARDGLIELDRGDDAREQRTTYRVLLPRIELNPPRKGPTMTTTEITDTNEATVPKGPLLPSEPPPQRVPLWQRTGYLPGPTQRISWSALDAARERHESAVETLAAAREAGDAETEAEALIEVAGIVLDADAELRATIDEAEAAFVKLAAEVRPEGPIEDGAAEAARVADLRPALEADQKIIRRVTLGILDADTFESERGDSLYPAAVVEAKQVRGVTR